MMKVGEITTSECTSAEEITMFEEIIADDAREIIIVEEIIDDDAEEITIVEEVIVGDTARAVTAVEAPVTMAESIEAPAADGHTVHTAIEGNGEESQQEESWRLEEASHGYHQWD